MLTNTTQWWDDVLPKEVNDLGKRHNVTLGMLTCGALLGDSKKRAVLMQRAEK